MRTEHFGELLFDRELVSDWKKPIKGAALAED